MGRESTTLVYWCLLLRVHADVTRNWADGTQPRCVFARRASWCQDGGHSKLGKPLRFPLLSYSLLLPITPKCPKLETCHFYFRRQWWGSKWFKKSLKLPMILLSPKIYWSTGFFWNKASVTSIQHIQVSIRKWGLQCESGDMLNGVPLVDGQIEVGFCILRGPRRNYLTGTQLGWRMYLPTHLCSHLTTVIFGLWWSYWAISGLWILGCHVISKF